MKTIKTITREEFETSHFSRKYWDENGGRPDKRPVWFDIETAHSGKVQRIYISATWHPMWAAWKAEADRALTAAVVEFDHFDGVFEKRGSSFPIVGSPQFLLERDSIQPGGFSIWINALCPGRHEFQRVVSEAKQRIEDQGKPLDSVRVAEFGAPLPLLPIPSSEFQGEPVNPGVAELLDSL